MANFLTVLRIVIALPIAILILEEQYTPAVILTLLGALSDFADGIVARKQKEDGGFGKILDPLADKVFVLSILIALVEVGKVSSIPVILLTFRELSVSVLRGTATFQGNPFGASLLGKAKTSAEFTAILLIMMGHSWGVPLLWVSVGLAYISFYDYAKTYLRTISGLNYP
ncbi:MAG: CDP-alcohol phosphatidyltransferase family protein [Aquificae bacterium]|nr:CDP-alcohol phosphatidyltransferase family protein [Aquificota bacterium]